MENYISNGLLVAGCDEAGRGCLAGPVVAAAVIWNKAEINPLIRDSKKLKENMRADLSEYIKNNATAWAIGVVEHHIIDQINILKASITAMHLAIEKLRLQPNHLIIDGNKFNPFQSIPHTCYVGGDDLYYQISCASILAKVHRDEIMKGYHNEYPVYNFHKNKGYGTKFHIEAIIKHGPTPIHRMTFAPMSNQHNLFNQNTTENIVL